jgi:hypothetical protein
MEVLMSIYGENLMISTTVSIAAAVIFLFFFISSSVMWVKNKRLSIKLKQAELDNVILVEYFGEQSRAEMKAENEIKDDFIKFLSDSRSWAFEYIENVQDGLGLFVDEIDPLIEYFDQYGDTMGMIPNYESMKKISVAFKELKKLLPDDYGKIDE